MFFIRRPLLLIVFLSLYGSSTAQFQSKKLLTTYYDYNWHETNEQYARYYSVAKKTDSGWFRGDYFVTDKKLQMLGLFEDDSLRIRNGWFRFYYPGGRLSSVGKYKHNLKEGIFLSFYQDGSVKDSGFYIHGNPVGTSGGWYANGNQEYELKLDTAGNGMYTAWFDNGQPKTAGKYQSGNQQGRWQYFHKTGKVSSVELYNTGIVSARQSFAEDGSPVTDFIADHEAEFPGGEKEWIKFINKNIYFPTHLDFEQGFMATVIVKVKITEEGKVGDVEVTLPLHPEFDKIAVDAIKKSPAWKPAMDHNRGIAYSFSMPIVFSRGYF